MSTPDHMTRRGLLARLTTLAGAWIFGSPASAAGRTPSATEGPFYPSPAMRLPDMDNDLVKVAGRLRQAGGEVIHLTGRVMDRNAAPLPGLRIEIWQCDVNGKYLHPGDRRGVDYDTGFQGFGHDITDAEGRYGFRTIKPTPYPGRTPHIHVKVVKGEDEILTTQFYLSDHPQNKRDQIYRRLSASAKRHVTMVLTQGPEALETEIDIII